MTKNNFKISNRIDSLLNTEKIFFTMSENGGKLLTKTVFKSWNWIIENGGLKKLISELDLNYKLTYENECLSDFLAGGMVNNYGKDIEMYQFFKSLVNEQDRLLSI